MINPFIQNDKLLGLRNISTLTKKKGSKCDDCFRKHNTNSVKRKDDNKNYEIHVSESCTLSSEDFTAELFMTKLYLRYCVNC